MNISLINIPLSISNTRYKVKSLFIIILLIGHLFVYCQKPQEAGILFSNNVTSYPVAGFSKVFYSQFHPGIDAWRAWKTNEKDVNQFWFAANAGGYYQRFVQTAIRLFGTIEYHYVFCERLSAIAGIGFGYVHSFEDNTVLKLNDEGKYEVKSRVIGRPQYTAQINIGGSIVLKKTDPESMRITMQMRVFIQGPFVNNYVPMLPINSFSLGICKPLKCKKNEK